MSHAPQSEEATRVALAACYRLAAHFQMTDLIYTHITARVPGTQGQFLINPYGLRWEEITASSLVKIDTDGQKIENTPASVNPAGFTIHSAVHTARADAHWVMHTHTKAGVAVSCLAEGLLPLNQIALQFFERLAYHDFEGIALDHAERSRIVADFGNHPALVLRNHGLLTVGRTAAEMFNTMFYLNRACEIQVATLSMGRDIVAIPGSIAQRVVSQNDQMSLDDGGLELEWAAHLRMLDSIDPTFRT